MRAREEESSGAGSLDRDEQPGRNQRKGPPGLRSDWKDKTAFGLTKETGFASQPNHLKTEFDKILNTYSCLEATAGNLRRVDSSRSQSISDQGVLAAVIVVTVFPILQKTKLRCREA